MKKSEMVKNIHWLLNDQIYTENEDGTGDIALEFASDLLEWIQEYGMLPPPCDIVPISLDREIGCIIEVTYNNPPDENGQYQSWEPEND